MTMSLRPLTQLTVVLGMHRSGTSAVANLLGRLGCSLPRNLMPPQADNPSGFAESLPLVRFNNGLLKRLDRTWADPRPIPDGAFDDPKWIELRAVANGVLHEQSADSGSLVFKDPRVCRLLPFWLPLFDALGARYVFMVRNPIEIAASLSRRNGIEPAHAEALWKVHIFECLAALGTRPVLALQYEDLLNPSSLCVADLAEWLALDPSAAARLASEVVDPGLRHHYFETQNVEGPVGVSELGRRLYQDVLQRATSGAPWSETFKELLARWRLERVQCL